MKFKLGISVSREVDSALIINISNKLEDFFNEENYGDGVKGITIGLICVSENYEAFFKINKPKYTKEKKVKGIDGITYYTENSFTYDCKINFNTYQSANDIGRKKLVSENILSISKEVFKKKRIKDFNEDDFIKALESFFIKKGYIE